MTLLSRLVSPAEGEAKLPVHQFMAALAEYERGSPAMKKADVAAKLGLSPEEQLELLKLTDKLDLKSVDRDLIHDVLLLGEYGIYSMADVKARLGV